MPCGWSEPGAAQRPIEGGVLTSGRTVDQVTEVNSNGDRMTYPVIEFADREERTHRFENEVGGGGVAGIQEKVRQVFKVPTSTATPSGGSPPPEPSRSTPTPP